MLQLGGVLEIIGAIFYLLFGGAAALLGSPLGGALILIVGIFAFGIGLGFFYLGAMLRHMGGSKK
jgi:hypothetical protein